MELAAQGGHFNLLTSLMGHVTESDKPRRLAAGSNRVEAVQFLVAKFPVCVDAHVGDDDGRTPLHHAAAAGADDCVRLLIDAKANVNAVSVTGATPIFDAVSYGFLSTVQLLHNRGASLGVCERKTQRTLLHAAASSPWDTQGSILAFLMEQFLQTDSAYRSIIPHKDWLGYTALHVLNLSGLTAQLPGFHEVAHAKLRTLCGEGKSDGHLDINSQDAAGQTLLHRFAATPMPITRGALATVAAIVLHGGRPDVPDKKGQTPIDVAAGINPAIETALRKYATMAPELRQMLLANASTVTFRICGAVEAQKAKLVRPTTLQLSTSGLACELSYAERSRPEWLTTGAPLLASTWAPD